MYPNNTMLNQQMAQLEQEFLQKKQNLMQNFYAQNNPQNNYQQNTQVQQAQNTQPAQNVNWVYVSGVDGAKNQIVQPGQTVWMMDNNEPYFYVKAVDGVGSSSLRIFQFAEVQEAAPEQPEQPQIDMSQYVQRDEFEKLKAIVEQTASTIKKQPAKSNKGVDDNG